MTQNRLVLGATRIHAAAKTQVSQALTIQGYCLSTLEQGKVDFSGFPTLAKLGNEINAGLATAQKHAKTYLDQIQPAILRNVANISNYYDLHEAVKTSLPPGTSKQEWIAGLKAIQEQTVDFQKNAGFVVKSLETLRDDLARDVAAFAKVVRELNAAVGGDNGVLADISRQLDDLQKKIAGVAVGLTLSGLAVVGGTFLILVGAVATFATAGLSGALIIGGTATVLLGVAGTVTTAIVLSKLLDEKEDLLKRRENLKAEVKLVTGVSAGYEALRMKAEIAVSAAVEMRNAWDFLSGDLANLATDLEQGTLTPDAAHNLFLEAANLEIQQVRTDMSTIRKQIVGVPVKKPAKTETTIGEFIRATSQKMAA